MPDRLDIEDTFHYHASVVYGLRIHSDRPFPLVVGCSIRTPKGEVIDLPARYILSNGLALWNVKAPSECASDRLREHRMSAWEGGIIFALWEDATFSRRLVDTGWVPWEAHGMIGASAAGLDIQDGFMERKYAGHEKMWKPL